MGFNTIFLPYGDTLQRHRTIYHQVLRAEVSASYHEVYFRQANELVLNLSTVTSAADLQHHLEAFVTCFSLSRFLFSWMHLSPIESNVL
jgi:hypothetical protein